MNVHCFQHVPFEGLGSMVTWIREKGHNLTYTRFFKNENIPDLEGIDILIVVGGPMSFDEGHIYPWQTEEKEFIREAIDNQKTILGICLGAQIIADAIDGSAKHGHTKEIGWFPVNWTEEKDNVGIEFFPNQTKVFHWHGDTFDIPKGAVHLASTSEFPNQAFLYNNNALGLQFHLEMTEASVKGMIENCGDELVKDSFVQEREEILSGLDNTSLNQKMMFGLLDYLAERTKL